MSPHSNSVSTSLNHHQLLHIENPISPISLVFVWIVISRFVWESMAIQSTFPKFSSAVLMFVRLRLCGENYLIPEEWCAVLGYECYICWYLFSPGRF
ncbi:hypothetical protein CDAR_11211 [Caerostris darwini]|uniref:Uncharacterized protein n=1 Tax=Caerostris darwini TaxID=1538125 RepID=A0AAV4RE34_9ARAC|nr:hypothetical protein CDAR_11211 [Caerostris darwini]